MICAWWITGLVIVSGQVPRPSSGEETSRALHAAHRSILEREASELKSLAERLTRDGQAEAARAVRARLPRPVAPDGPTRFVPLPDVIPPSPSAESGGP